MFAGTNFPYSSPKPQNFAAAFAAPIEMRLHVRFALSFQRVTGKICPLLQSEMCHVTFPPIFVISFYLAMPVNKGMNVCEKYRGRTGCRGGYILPVSVNGAQ